MFMLSILLMVLPTFTLAFIPGYETLGFLAPFLLILIRIFSRYCYRRRITWCLGFCKRTLQRRSKGFFFELFKFGYGFGNFTRKYGIFTDQCFFSTEEIAAYAWRIAFLWVEFLGLFLFICVDFYKKLLFLNKCKKNGV